MKLKLSQNLDQWVSSKILVKKLLLFFFLSRDCNVNLTKKGIAERLFFCVGKRVKFDDVKCNE